MTTDTMTDTRNYEVMFLVSQGEAAGLGSLVEHFEEIFRRADATIVSMRKWDERRLAYPIDKQKRGVYFLAYINAPTDAPTHIERDCVISERILRVLVTNAEHLTDEEIASQDARAELATEAKLKAEQGEEETQAKASMTIGAPEPQEAPAAPASEEAPAEPASDAAPASEAPAETGEGEKPAEG